MLIPADKTPGAACPRACCATRPPPIPRNRGAGITGRRAWSPRPATRRNAPRSSAPVPRRANPVDAPRWGTGLVGGQVMTDGPAPLILSMERMTAIRDTFAEEGVMIAESGVTLQAARQAAAGVGRQFPLSLASQGSAQIGGVLSTNAGGVNVLRYGNARARCLGVEAVLPDGSVMHDLKRLRKDNTGYDLRDLLIGAEGTLGIITAASLVLAPVPAETGVAMLVVDSPAAALSLLSLAQARMAGGVTAFELISGQGLHFLDAAFPDMRQPFDTRPDWLVLIEVGLPAGLSADAALEGLFTAGTEAGLVHDGVIAQSGQQGADLWALREHIPLANRHIGAIASHDISLPLSEVARFIDDARAWLAGQGTCASTASAIWATATCITTCSRRRAGPATTTKPSAATFRAGCTKWSWRVAGRSRPNMGWGGSRPPIWRGGAIRRGWRRCGRSRGRWTPLAS